MGLCLGFKIMKSEKTKGEQAGLENRLPPPSGGDGGKTWSWNRVCSPPKGGEKYYLNSI